jgi:hypothetical protein
MPQPVVPSVAVPADLLRDLEELQRVDPESVFTVHVLIRHRLQAFAEREQQRATGEAAKSAPVRD